MSKAAGNDSSRTRMLLELSEKNSVTVVELFTKSVKFGDAPQDWKMANATAVYEKDKKSSPSTYRPVSLTVNLCKVSESIMRDSVTQHLKRHNLVTRSQHEIVRNKYCLFNKFVNVYGEN